MTTVGLGVVGELIRRLSVWVDNANAGKDPEAIRWGRLAKVAEESGEVISAFIGATNQNPRKGVYASENDVIAELYDTALTALCAAEHMTGNQGRALAEFRTFVISRYNRANIDSDLDAVSAYPPELIERCADHDVPGCICLSGWVADPGGQITNPVSSDDMTRNRLTQNARYGKETPNDTNDTVRLIARLREDAHNETGQLGMYARELLVLVGYPVTFPSDNYIPDAGNSAHS